MAIAFYKGSDLIKTIYKGTTSIVTSYDGLSAIEQVIYNTDPLGWWDANDYTSGTTWYDRTSNSYDLTLANPSFYSYDTSTLGNASFLFSTGSLATNGGRATTAQVVMSWDADISFTYIEILRPANVPLPSNPSTFTLQSGTSITSTPVTSNRIYTTLFGGNSYYLNAHTYDSSKTSFVARRVQSGFNNVNNKLKVSYGDNLSTSLTHYGAGDFTGSGDVNYTFTYLTTRIGHSANNGQTYPAYYAVSLVYNKILTDSEIELIYSYYRHQYGLL